MNRRNYQKELDRIIQKRGKRLPRVLLHSCCGPCSSAVLEYLTQYFDVTLLWYNPNIYPREEFDRRFKTQVELIEKMGLAEKVSVLARSDSGCAALFCKAAMQAAGRNVKVNTRLMADKAHADALEARAEQLLAEFVPQADRVYQTVSNE